MTTTKKVAPNDWLSHPELLPPRPQTFTELKYTRLFAVDLQGRNHHDQYVFLAPNGLAVVGLAPSHPLISTHRKATGYTPLPFQYIPPNLESLSAEELVSPVADEDAEEGAQGGPTAADGAEPGAQGQVATDAQAEGGEAGTEAGGPTAGEAGAAGAPPGPAGSGGRGGPASQPEVRPFPPSECARVNFDVGGGKDRASTKLSGKRKNRGAPLHPNTLLARVEGKGGERFPVLCVAGGQLLEVNDQLLTRPGLLYDRPTCEGYVAILFPTPQHAQQLRTSLMSEADYLRLRGLTPEDLL